MGHKRLLEFEIPLLSTKYGSFVTQNYISTGDKTTFLYDKNDLGAKNHFISHLKQINFFSLKDIKQNINLINNTFDIIFLALFTPIEITEFLYKNFKGKIFWRIFSYTPEIATIFRKISYLSKYKVIKILAAYKEFIKPLTNKLRNFDNIIVRYFKIGLSNELITKIENTYNPQKNKILFVCSRINKHTYYNQIYQDFIKHFSTFEFNILGQQNKDVINPYVINDIPENIYHQEMAKYKVMYYHGKDPFHLHYHPLEAVAIGIPVIFHNESLLASYLPNSPGKCSNIEEAKIKVNRILNNDYQFINQIITEQSKTIPLLKATSEELINVLENDKSRLPKKSKGKKKKRNKKKNPPLGSRSSKQRRRR